MPILTAAPTAPVVAVVAAQPGVRATIGPVTGPVIAWALVSDPIVPGGARLDPVWVAGGRTWTPDQYRAATGTHAAVTITAE